MKKPPLYYSHLLWGSPKIFLLQGPLSITVTLWGLKKEKMTGPLVQSPCGVPKELKIVLSKYQSVQWPPPYRGFTIFTHENLSEADILLMQ